jgi:hypothetical protein
MTRKEVYMGYTQVGLEDKILIMYPEVRDLSPRFNYDESKETWVVKLRKGSHEQTVFLCKVGADACMDNTYCEAFGKEIKEALKKLH